MLKACTSQRDSDLQRRARAVLARASVVAEGATVGFEPRTSSSAPGSRPPAEARDDRRAGSPVGVHELIAQNLANAGDDPGRLERAVVHAEELLDRVQRSPWARLTSPGDELQDGRRGWRPAVATADGEVLVETEAEWVARVLVQYEGTPASEAAAWERCHVKAIWRVRGQNARRPADGVLDGRARPAAAPADLDARRAAGPARLSLRTETVARRREEVRRLEVLEPHLSGRKIAERLGLDEATVRSDRAALREEQRAA